MARRYCKNTVPGKQGRGRKYPAAVRAEVVMAMIGSNSICAVARKYKIGELLKSEEENLQDAAETGLVVRSAPGTYDRQLSDEERSELEKQLQRYEEKAMSDKDAANVAAVLLTAAANAAALAPKEQADSGQSTPAVLMEARAEETGSEVVLDGSSV